MELVGLQAYLLIGTCSGNWILSELCATMDTLRVMQVCPCIGHIRTAAVSGAGDTDCTEPVALYSWLLL